MEARVSLSSLRGYFLRLVRPVVLVGQPAKQSRRFWAKCSSEETFVQVLLANSWFNDDRSTFEQLEVAYYLESPYTLC